MVITDFKEYHKQYYLKNKEKMIERMKKFNEDNKERLKEYQKEYHKKYYETRKDILSKRNKARYRKKKYGI